MGQEDTWRHIGDIVGKEALEGLSKGEETPFLHAVLISLLGVADE